MNQSRKTKLVGTLFDEEEILSKQNYYNIKARDEKNKVRWTGAFTGGFTAGYHNTVGSKEGFKPTQFISSRKEKTELPNQTIESFMDEEDLETLQINKNLTKAHEFRTIEEQNSFGIESIAISHDIKNTFILDLYEKSAKFNTLCEDSYYIKLLNVTIHANDLSGLGAIIDNSIKKPHNSMILKKRRYIDKKSRINNFDFDDTFEEEGFEEKVLAIDKELKVSSQNIYKGLKNEFAYEIDELYSHQWQYTLDKTPAINIIEVIAKKNLSLSLKLDSGNVPKLPTDNDTETQEIIKLFKKNDKFIKSEIVTNNDYGLQIDLTIANISSVADNNRDQIKKVKFCKGDKVNICIKKLVLNEIVYKRFNIKPQHENDFTNIVKEAIHKKEDAIFNNEIINKLNEITKSIENNKQVYQQLFG